MKDEAKIWLKYSQENFESAKILLDNKLFNPCLQNIQQSVEKGLKALCIGKNIKLKKTHSINELRGLLNANGVNIEIEDDDCDFLDSIYLPSKYPIESVLPEFNPDLDICTQAVSKARKIFDSINKLIVSD